MECNIEKNKRNCTCTYEPCSRKGKCCECIVLIIGTWVNFPDVYSLPRWRELTTVRLKNLLKPISKFVYRISYIVKKKILMYNM